jgi:hypothetical protein
VLNDVNASELRWDSELKERNHILFKIEDLEANLVSGSTLTLTVQLWSQNLMHQDELWGATSVALPPHDMHPDSQVAVHSLQPQGRVHCRCYWSKNFFSPCCPESPEEQGGGGGDGRGEGAEEGEEEEGGGEGQRFGCLPFNRACLK